jgi:hypothetical protein
MAVELASAPLLVQQAYRALGPWAREDEDVWELLQFVYALFNPIVEIDGLVRDTDTYTGWGQTLDVDAAPEKFLPWLAQFVGVEPIKGLDAASQRLRIKQAAGFNRGSVAAIRAAAALHLTGTRRVDLYERDTSPWTFRVRTYLSETPDSQKVADAVAELKPGGLVFIYEIQEGPEIDQMVGTIDEQDSTIDAYSDVVPA